MPQYKLYLDELKGLAISDFWMILIAYNPVGNERLGYPTQKPLALLERIIAASSNEGDVVLDPFCGCGTAVHAAQKLNRRWIGIDITHLAIGLIERRLKDAFPGIHFEVHGTPKDFAGAEDLAQRDKYQFQMVGSHAYQRRAIRRQEERRGQRNRRLLLLQAGRQKDRGRIVSVKGGETVHRNAVGELRGVVERDKAPLGVLITLGNLPAP